jgi:hypothetical protein
MGEVMVRWKLLAVAVVGAALAVGIGYSVFKAGGGPQLADVLIWAVMGAIIAPTVVWLRYIRGR